MRLSIYVLYAVFGALRVLGAISYSPGVSYDSLAYLSAAGTLQDGRGFLMTDGTPYTLYAPLMPLLLTVIAPYALNALAFAVTIVVTGAWMQRLKLSLIAQIMALTALVLSPALMYVYRYVWSEGIFIPLALACLLALSYLPDRRALVGAALLTALALLARYAGVTLFVSGIVCIALSGGRGLRLVASRLLVYSVISLFPLALWIIHNLSADGTLLGPRTAGRYSLTQNAQSAMQVLTDWYWFVGPYVLTALLVLIAWRAILWRRTAHSSSS